jgi:hypothetical protein
VEVTWQMTIVTEPCAGNGLIQRNHRVHNNLMRQESALPIKCSVEVLEFHEASCVAVDVICLTSACCAQATLT